MKPHAIVAALAASVLAGCATSGPVTDANGNAAAILTQARELRHADRAEQAAAIVERALLTVAPGDVALQGELARDLVYSDPRRALDLLAEAFDPAEPDAKLLMVGGVAYDMLGDHVAAQRMYGEALKVAPGDAAVLHNMDLSRKLAADERRTVASMRPRPKEVTAAPLPKPKVITAPEPTRTFAERWRLL